MTSPDGALASDAAKAALPPFKPLPMKGGGCRGGAAQRRQCAKQRATLERRHALVDALYASHPDHTVVTV